MVEEKDGETRIEYLLRVLDEFMANTIAGEITIYYDDTTCDGMCLAQDISDVLNDLGVTETE